jgi:hypothetical protein
MEKNNQIRITIPKWIAKLKGWGSKTHLEAIPLNDKTDKVITPQAIIVIKEVKKDG